LFWKKSILKAILKNFHITKNKSEIAKPNFEENKHHQTFENKKKKQILKSKKYKPTH
jgi:hypothetical protein